MDHGNGHGNGNGNGNGYGNGNGNHNGDSTAVTKTCPMIMVFHGGHCERILWRSWVAYSLTEFIFSCLALAALAFAFEFIKFLREYLMLQADRTKRASANKAIEAADVGTCPVANVAPGPEPTYWTRIMEKSHFIQTLLYFLQMAVAYLLMLVFMNFNYWLCLAVVIGLAVGYFFFGWIKRHNVYEQDCC